MDKHVTVRVKSGRAMSWPPTDDEHSIAFAYNQAGESYESYADGGADELFAFDGQHAFGDRTIWSILDGKLRALRSSGARSVRILDLGCGPGTWLCRVVMRASELGFTSIQARGIDIAETQVRRASARGRRLAIAGLELAFESRRYMRSAAGSFFERRSLSLPLRGSEPYSDRPYAEPTLRGRPRDAGRLHRHYAREGQHADNLRGCDRRGSLVLA